VEISLSKVKTCGELRKVFLKKMIDRKYIPVHKKIIVFEDIDCMTDIIKDRDEKSEKKNKDDSNDDEKLIGSVLNKKNQKKGEGLIETLIACTKKQHKDDDKITLSYLIL
jgi:hypothetical protein